MKRRVFLAVLLTALVVGLMPGSALAKGNSDETLLNNSVKHYIQVLIAYNNGDLGEACGQLQAAASNAKHVDPELAGLLQELRASVRFAGTGNLCKEVASQIAIIYNKYNDGSYPMFNPVNPLKANPKEQRK